ncbi:MAG: hypothetical protein Q9220_003802 [cf. Caloplaca sp. 1 TL-2023]
MATQTSFPPGGTWFETLKKSFVDVPVDSANDNAIPTSDFLEAAESLTTLFGIPTSASKIRDRQLASPDTSSTLQSLVLNELKQKKHVATEGLLWLVRGLDFTSLALRHNLSTSPTSELSTSFRTAYTTTLKPHHSFLVKPVFSAAMSATPYKKDFYNKLGEGGEEGVKVKEEMGRWLGSLERQVGVLKAFMGRKECKW